MYGFNKTIRIRPTSTLYSLKVSFVYVIYIRDLEEKVNDIVQRKFYHLKVSFSGMTFIAFMYRH